MNTSLRKSLTGIALSCALLCSTVPAHASISKKAGYVVLTGCGGFCFLGGIMSLSKEPLGGLLIMIPSGYTTYRGVHKLIKGDKTKNKDTHKSH